MKYMRFSKTSRSTTRRCMRMGRFWALRMRALRSRTNIALSFASAISLCWEGYTSVKCISKRKKGRKRRGRGRGRGRGREGEGERARERMSGRGREGRGKGERERV